MKFEDATVAEQLEYLEKARLLIEQRSNPNFYTVEELAKRIYESKTNGNSSGQPKD